MTEQPRVKATLTTCQSPAPSLPPPPRFPGDVELARLFADLAAELARAVDPDAVTAAVETLITVALRLGARESWAAWDSWSSRSETASPPTDSARSFTLFGIREERPGPRWQALFAATWPAYRAWYLQDGDDARPDLATARAQLTRHMPELVSTWEAMVALTGDDDVAARMLTLWDAPAFAPGCSQAAQVGGDPIMVRNYDYSPDLFEWVVYSSEFTSRKVIGTSDCLWGLLDGMNDDGLVISLTHGGRQSSAPGFAIPLVVRYLLEVAGTVDEARAALDRTPGRRVVQPHHDGRHRCGGHRIRVTRQRRRSTPTRPSRPTTAGECRSAPSMLVPSEAWSVKTTSWSCWTSRRSLRRWPLRSCGPRSTAGGTHRVSGPCSRRRTGHAPRSSPTLGPG